MTQLTRPGPARWHLGALVRAGLGEQRAVDKVSSASSAVVVSSFFTFSIGQADEAGFLVPSWSRPARQLIECPTLEYLEYGFEPGFRAV